MICESDTFANRKENPCLFLMERGICRSIFVASSTSKALFSLLFSSVRKCLAGRKLTLKSVKKAKQEDIRESHTFVAVGFIAARRSNTIFSQLFAEESSSSKAY